MECSYFVDFDLHKTPKLPCHFKGIYIIVVSVVRLSAGKR